jgi:hypothetical protein
VARREADNAADTAFRLRDKNAPPFDIELRRSWVGLQRREIVVENKRLGIGRVSCAAGADISGAEIAIGIVGLAGLLLRRFGLALPWPLGPMRRD